jgi:hypothetical protein
MVLGETILSFITNYNKTFSFYKHKLYSKSLYFSPLVSIRTLLCVMACKEYKEHKFELICKRCCKGDLIDNKISIRRHDILFYLKSYNKKMHLYKYTSNKI